MPTSSQERGLSLAQLSEKIRHASVSFERENHTSVGHIRKREGSALAFSDRLQAVIRVVLDEKRGLLPSRGWRAIVVSLIARTTVTLRAAHTLAAAGHGREVPVVVRSALESLITATFIMKRDGARRAKRWAQYAVFLRGRFLERYPVLMRPRLGAPYTGWVFLPRACGVSWPFVVIFSSAVSLP